ncbi:hypothetical protein HGP16_31670 [Rhizobium sp. P40RR-XXII]|uniref:hypothetical protein n=1 Tax=unclassified Rhizobium TaxID=2613769 RepID=UPI00145714FD|nr:MULTISPECIES: hypothetical protein [unclassified Rhizobium]NLR89122.1 hypothetical protein [Rhizobium sp. P28RR-XV]NLS21060.1 hypothetical protein [Rhizobium sp. P40RR-XXII]
MFDIARPFVTEDDPDRHIRCQDAIQAAFRDLIGAAIEAGWSEREILLAIADLVDNQLLSLEANGNTEILLALLKRMT